MCLITNRLTEIQQKWEDNNSVFAELKKDANRNDMFQYFKDASNGIKTAKLFVNFMKRILKRSLGEAFDEEIVEIVYKTAMRIRQKQWLHDAKLLRKHIDLHLIQLLDKDDVHAVLFLVRSPQKMYNEVMRKLVTESIPNVHDEWSTFTNHLKAQVKLAASSAMTCESDRAKRFVEKLHELCVESFPSRSLVKSLGINCGDEYKECRMRQ